MKKYIIMALFIFVFQGALYSTEKYTGGKADKFSADNPDICLFINAAKDAARDATRAASATEFFTGDERIDIDARMAGYEVYGARGKLWVALDGFESAIGKDGKSGKAAAKFDKMISATTAVKNATAEARKACIAAREAKINLYNNLKKGS